MAGTDAEPAEICFSKASATGKTAAGRAVPAKASKTESEILVPSETPAATLLSVLSDSWTVGG
jgi:hypothetical protein